MNIPPVFGDNAGNDAWASVQWQERKENLYAAFAGCVHGCFDFLTSHAYLFQSLAFAAGCDDLECSLEERLQIQQAFAISQSNQIAATDAFVQQTMGVDANNAIYQAFRSGTTTTLEVATIAMGGYGLAKGAVGVVKAARVGMLEARMASQALKQEAKYIAKPSMSLNRSGSGAGSTKNLGSLASKDVNFCKINAIIEETLNGSGPMSSKYRVSSDEALRAGKKFLGTDYKQLGKSNSGVFRSADGLRGFRIDNNSLLGLHDPNIPHFHLEVFKSGANKPYINNHISFYD
ncbi:hypothetical protein [Candidatus Protochlamydia naegleriophila]|nr:hypothetical protein [Candidatus Protochlamydia naegleriophila]